MNITFQTYGKAGTALRVIITHCGKVYRKGLGISAEKWNQKRQKSGNVITDEALKKIHIGLESILDEFSSQQDIEAALARIEDGKWSDTTRVTDTKKNVEIPSFDEFFKAWSERPCGAKKQNRLVYNNVVRLIGTDFTWEELDSAFYTRLIKKFDEAGFRPNYQGVMIGRIKTCLNEALAMHYKRDADFREWKKPKESTFAIALSDDEASAIENFKTDSVTLAKTRDLFIIGLYTAARFSDYSRLSLEDIHDGKIRFVQEKTEGTVIIPCSPKVKAVLERNGGRAPYMVDQVYNRNIKRICQEVGITNQIQVPPTIRRKLNKKAGEPVYKWELVSSHTCRRTAISRLYRQGVSPSLICKVSGHKTESQLMKYIKVTAEESAIQLAELDFFK